MIGIAGTKSPKEEGRARASGGGRIACTKRNGKGVTGSRELLRVGRECVRVVLGENAVHLFDQLGPLER